MRIIIWMSILCLFFGALIIVLVAFCLRTSKGLVWGNLITYIYICILGQFSLQILLFIILLVFILFYFSGLFDSISVFAIGLIFVNFIASRSYLEAHSLQSPNPVSRPILPFKPGPRITGRVQAQQHGSLHDPCN